MEGDKDPFDQEAAQQGKEKGMASSDQNADPYFKEMADQAIREAALTKPEVSVNDIWIALEPQEIRTHNNKAAGSSMLRCARNGWIVKTDRTITSVRKSRNKGETRIWRSLIYRASNANS